jgi:chromosome segregation ATPase
MVCNAANRAAIAEHNRPTPPDDTFSKLMVAQKQNGSYRSQLNDVKNENETLRESLDQAQKQLAEALRKQNAGNSSLTTGNDSTNPPHSSAGASELEQRLKSRTLQYFSLNSEHTILKRNHEKMQTDHARAIKNHQDLDTFMTEGLGKLRRDVSASSRCVPAERPRY